MRLSDADILKLLPLFMRDDDAVKALAKAVNKLIQDPGAKYKQLRTWDQIDYMDHEQLDELAWELNIDWYSSALDLERKRKIIKISDQVHRKRGTKWAVEQLISAYFGPGYVQEWFEYGGPPFEFKVLTTNKAVTDEMYQEFIKIAKTTKNVRSRLEGVYYYGIYSTPFRYGKSMHYVAFPFILCGTKPNRAFIGQIRKISINIGADFQGRNFNFIPCGTKKTGTIPTPAYVSGIYKAPAKINSAAEAITFAPILSGTNKVGTTPMPAYVSGIHQVTAKINNTIQALTFTPVKCGTRKTGEVV